MPDSYEVKFMVMISLNYVLQIINLHIFFHRILGYSLKESKNWRIFGIVLITVSLIIRLIFRNDIDPFLNLIVLNGVMAFLPMVIFSGKKKQLFLLGIIYRIINVFLFLIVETMSIHHIKIMQHVMELFHLSFGCMTQLIICFILSSISLLIKIKKIKIHDSLESLNTELLIAFVGLLILLRWNGGIVSTDFKINTAVLTEKTNFLALFVALTLLVGLIVVEIMIIQRKKLTKMNELNQECINVQSLQYQRLKENNSEIYAFKHDYKAHLSMINSYLEIGDLNSTRVYIEQLSNLNGCLSTYSTGNIIIDAVLNQYNERGKKELIKIEVIGTVPQNMKILEAELCVLLSNAMSNAYEATLQCENDRVIEFQIANNGGFLFIKIINPSNSSISYLEKGLLSTKADGDLHGFGTRNMIKIAEKNGGSVSWKCDNGKIITTIRIRYI